MKTLTNTGGLVVKGVEGGGRTDYFFQENWYLNPLDFSDDKQQKPTWLVSAKKEIMEAFLMRWYLSQELSIEKNPARQESKERVFWP